MLLKSVRLNIRLSDCRLRNYLSNRDCPYARALKRVVVDGTSVLVGGSSFSLGHDFTGEVKNFEPEHVYEATRSLSRRVMIPVKYLKEEFI